jgi:predicted MPP superfamily phosphohydrolase
MRTAASILVIALVAAFGTWAFWLEPRSLVVHRAEITLEKWPASLAGLRVALLSDLHIGSPYWDLPHLERLVEATNAEHPDLVLLAGDYQINGVAFGSWVAPEPIAARLGKLEAPLGVIAVLGNHDYRNDGPRTERALERAGTTVLENESKEIRYRESRFVVVGLANLLTRPQAVRATLAEVPADGASSCRPAMDSGMQPGSSSKMASGCSSPPAWARSTIRRGPRGGARRGRRYRGALPTRAEFRRRETQ